MKNKSNHLLLASLFGGLLFSFLFWEERLAINLLIYSIFILTVTYLNPEVSKSKKFKIYGLAHLFSAVLVVVNNTDLSIAAYYISLLVFIGISHNQQIRSVFAALLAAILQMITTPFNAITNLSKISVGNFNMKPVFRLIKYIFIPVIAVIFFTVLYAAANALFAHYVETILTSIFNFFEGVLHFFFKDLDVARFFHFCLGIVLTSGLLLAFLNKTVQNAELKATEQLNRVKLGAKQKTLWYLVIETFAGSLLTRKMALKTEYITGVISFVALNLLLLLLNVIDISTLWFGYKPAGGFSGALHEGTNSLIFSIIMAMAVILYFFRGNLNFYSKSKTLKTLAFTWMIQNVILIISVLIKDGYYIEFYGLTHKRIGVLVFSLLCIIGLATVYAKVAKQKTLFYLFKINGSVWFILLLAFSVINWDVAIAKYNLSKSEEISLDADYLLSLSDKTLPVLDKHRSKLHYTSPKINDDRETAKPQTADFYGNQLDKRIGYFKERYEEAGWASWNLQDWKAAAYFKIKQSK
ncbi:DUF4173 domain-containing protein [Pedobacter petrophilus]|uniref:DUF4173 domain-containing protein n=1 Tax=Pedobacter petrophilus TaxID=1908241 RepID=A0A7K0FWL7_9SPHI|nr:DUF4173 domain-containing protein [Pedobacter petrophilus]MRX75136.1 DUF4173 domain-containing protein [Pedobacter petrophilus]